MSRTREHKSHSKVFGIGLAKTGTTSLCAALRILGYSAIDFPIGLRGVEHHDAATDIPIADSFELLDRRYPRSKFIYTVRQRDDWIRSCDTHWVRFINCGRETRPEAVELIKRLYGTIDFDATLFREAYDRHESRVLSYFSSRSDDLLVIDVCAGESGWKSLCTFLGKEMPNVPFPHVNKTKQLLEHHLQRSGIFTKIITNRPLKKIVRKAKKVNRMLTHRNELGKGDGDPPTIL
jgi:hypothetical protein